MTYILRLGIGFICTLILTCVTIATQAQLNTYSLNTKDANVNWQVSPVDQVSNESEIHQVGYNTAAWVNAIVPGTVFTSYVEEGLEPDPNFGDNIYNVDTEAYNKDFFSNS